MKISGAFLIAFFTTIIRYYDYALFGLAAGILSKNFIPHSSESNEILWFFALFSLSVIARPIGSIIFGTIADKYGRVASIKLASCVASIATISIAMIPSFEYINIASTILLILFRMMFLASLGGETDSIRVYIAEKITPKNKNLANGVIGFCNQIGVLLASISYHYALHLGEFNYLWRINFLAGGIFGFIIILMRNYFQETEIFLNIKHSGDKSNIYQLIKNNKSKFILSMLITGCSGGIYHFLVIFFSTFSSSIIHINSPIEAQKINIILIVIYALTSLISGFLADHINKIMQIIFALLLSLIFTIFLQFSCANVFVIMIVGLIPFYLVPLQIIIQSIFNVPIKVRMCSLSHSIGSVIFSSTIPFISMLLWNSYGSINLILGILPILLLIILLSVAYLSSFISKGD